MNFTDSVTITGTKRRADGALLVDANVARTGIQIYAGYEVGKPEIPTVRVFRSATEVHSDATLASFAHRPVTNDHPADLVTADNWKAVAVGQTADEVAAKDRFIRVPLMVSDAAAIADVIAGKRELSAGYTCDLDFTPGVTESGEAFDAQQRNIRANHVAIVTRGRAGKSCRIGDGWGGEFQQDEGIKTVATKLIQYDGMPIEVTDMAEAVILRLQRQLSDSAAAVTKTAADHAAALAAKDTEIGGLKVQVKELTDKLPTPEGMAKMVKDRADLVALASSVVKDGKFESMADADIRRAVVVAKYGEAFAKDMAPAAIDGAFLAATKDASAAPVSDPFRQSFQRPAPVADGVIATQDAWEQSLQNAWKN